MDELGLAVESEERAWTNHDGQPTVQSVDELRWAVESEDSVDESRWRCEDADQLGSSIMAGEARHRREGYQCCPNMYTASPLYVVDGALM